jgi:arginine/lysine/ornithine decarboxylase
MPGHKGKDNFGFEKFDITEIDGADVLYKAKGIIKESEDNASALFGTAETYYSTSILKRSNQYLPFAQNAWLNIER